MAATFRRKGYGLVVGKGVSLKLKACGILDGNAEVMTAKSGIEW